MPPSTNTWDPALYEAQHSFVWQLGRGLIELLAPCVGERILDIGCGTGQLTAEIAGTGADTLGLDSSPGMIAQARQNYPADHHPNLRFILADAAALTFTAEFDAVFSNAALHWMLDTEAVARGIFAALKPGGRLVLECGGRGNIATIDGAIRHVYEQLLRQPLPPPKTVFRSVSELASTLESQGFEVTDAALFDRPTRLEGERGMERWLEQFAAWQFAPLAPVDRAFAIAQTVDRLRPVLFRDGHWTADYRRLRIVAVTRK